MPIMESTETEAPKSTQEIQQTHDIEIDSNENKDTSNLADIQAASPKKSQADISDGKCFSSIMNCLPINNDSEIILVKQ